MIEEGGVIAARYKLLSLIGEGGMASVWRAEDQTLKRMVAIKLLYVRGHRDPRTIIDQFLREARIAASVQHRNVIHTVDFGIADDQLPYMVMELLTGESLGERMGRTPPLTMEETVHVASLTLRGLAAVHEAGIVHRDLKPQNIFLHHDVDTVYPKILDFGISRSIAGDESRASAISTQEGMIVGTPDYMSPEQARGEKDIDKRADIYSMAAIIYEGVTGRLPYLADTIGQLIVEIVTTRPKPMKEVRPDVPEVLSDVVEQAMSHDREERFVDASAFRRALLSAAERAFAPVRAQAVVSDAPARITSGIDLPPSAAQSSMELETNTGGKPGWGDFEAPATRAAHGGLVMAKETPQPTPTQAADTTARMGPRDAANLGDSPFDSLGGDFGDTGPLDIDYGRAPPPRAGRVTPRTNAQSGAGAPRLVGPNRLKQSAPKKVPARRGGPRMDRMWILPLVLAIALLLLIVGPGLWSAPPPSAAAAAELEAKNPATAESLRQLQGLRRHDIGARPPALRDVVF